MGTLSKWLKKAERAISNIIPHQHSADRRAANEAIKEQMDYYKKQKEEMEAEKTRIEGEKEQERQKVNQKQIKSLRHAYRAPGFMADASDSAGEKTGD